MLYFHSPHFRLLLKCWTNDYNLISGVLWQSRNSQNQSVNLFLVRICIWTCMHPICFCHMGNLHIIDPGIVWLKKPLIPVKNSLIKWKEFNHSAIFHGIICDLCRAESGCTPAKVWFNLGCLSWSAPQFSYQKIQERNVWSIILQYSVKKNKTGQSPRIWYHFDTNKDDVDIVISMYISLLNASVVFL